jgi:hypothetical protein
MKTAGKQLPSHWQFVSVIFSAFATWLGLVYVSGIVEIVCRVIVSTADNIPTGDIADVSAVTAVIVFGTWLWIGRGHNNLSTMELVSVGAFWALLSILANIAIQWYLTDHYVVRFLFGVLDGGDEFGASWTREFLVVVQFIAPAIIGILRRPRMRWYRIRPMRYS